MPRWSARASARAQTLSRRAVHERVSVCGKEAWGDDACASLASSGGFRGAADTAKSPLSAWRPQGHVATEGPNFV